MQLHLTWYVQSKSKSSMVHLLKISCFGCLSVKRPRPKKRRPAAKSKTCSTQVWFAEWVLAKHGKTNLGTLLSFLDLLHNENYAKLCTGIASNRKEHSENINHENSLSLAIYKSNVVNPAVSISKLSKKPSNSKWTPNDLSLNGTHCSTLQPSAGWVGCCRSRSHVPKDPSRCPRRSNSRWSEWCKWARTSNVGWCRSGCLERR